MGLDGIQPQLVRKLDAVIIDGGCGILGLNNTQRFLSNLSHSDLIIWSLY